MATSKRSRRPPVDRPAGPPKKTARSSNTILDRMSPGELAIVLRALLKKHPDLKPDAETVAVGMVSSPSVEDITEDVLDAVTSLGIDAFKGKANAAFSIGEIPGRNAFLIFVAMMVCQASPAIIAIGIHDGTPYYDCSEGFLKAIQVVVDGYAAGRVKITAPFLKWNKLMIWELCRKHDLPVHLTYSCEKGTQQPCGKCLSTRDVSGSLGGFGGDHLAGGHLSPQGAAVAVLEGATFVSYTLPPGVTSLSERKYFL